ncbi:SDR family oxidoreductase [Paraburkholderia caballeronis]|uniref:NADP-dependent 3-hydroxy acid dehydrogenase YdfG n=1 Tax=Paraburkholderia caballeronis TaxID=416943 RepID=A0A1H7QQH1_9BURK|nr:SDR family oxidoreductase [Paraburkholderia caballeronis]PXW22434.1 NADP-dependent 3-hydroxy acid dehydrogenase YdfG [Paraburkholderia caballeronis]PXW96305.1 NADP-dependent 3-hydroxy acid dehydrogenase YdfG [Paraburkholderia caballeronis]RAJ92716.1 NADP-dependent 3-hydroxy acid dehydrogenase YdfG [Paraburkholderia caballeronis]TDV15125.1 NADP-dependent 3-hydroxy acid dehydrogenase YdfG [Paraburkholderia caballeronis]TDV16750.1 NADP-dependent 3-hydroxy acid dehydrogenase YdfG [Paraburkholde
MGRVVLVTGACGGIGSALCRRFVDAGDTVLALDRDAAGVNALAAELGGAQVEPLAADVADAAAVHDAVARAVAARGPVDVAVANAGGALGTTLAHTDAAAWRRDVELNLNGTYYTVEAVRASMIERRTGVLVLVGSVNGLTALGHPAYSAAKAGLVSFTKALAIELGQYGIRANIVCPGTVKTPAWRARVERNPDVFEQLKKWYPLGDVATPDDIADAVQFLASPLARVITGVALPVDAGLMAGNRLMANELTLDPL